jgi:hypothetical protein
LIAANSPTTFDVFRRGRLWLMIVTNFDLMQCHLAGPFLPD